MARDNRSTGFHSRSWRQRAAVAVWASNDLVFSFVGRRHCKQGAYAALVGHTWAHTDAPAWGDHISVVS